MARKGGKDRGLIEVKVNGVSVWYVRLTHNGVTLPRFGPFTTKTEAKDFYRDRKAEQGRGLFFPDHYCRRKPGNTLIKGDLVEKVIDAHLDRRDMKRKKSRQDDERYAAFWKERCAGKGMGDLSKTFFQDVVSWLEEDQEYATSTVYNYMQFMRHCILCYLQDHDLRNPLRGVLIPHPDPAGRVNYLHDEDEPALMEALGPVYSLWVKIALDTGLRSTEQRERPWTDIDLNLGIITLPDPKAGKVQYVRISAECIEWFRQLPSRETSPWPFPAISDLSKPIGGAVILHDVLYPALDKAGLLEKGITWHTFRHTFASRLAMEGATETELVSALRHSGPSLIKRYVHLMPQHMQGVLGRLGARRARLLRAV